MHAVSPVKSKLLWLTLLILHPDNAGKYNDCSQATELAAISPCRSLQGCAVQHGLMFGSTEQLHQACRDATMTPGMCCREEYGMWWIRRMTSG